MNNGIKNFQSSFAFTLVELLVTIVVVGILASMSVAVLQEYFRKAYNTQALANFRSGQTVILAFDQELDEQCDPGRCPYRHGYYCNLARMPVTADAFCTNTDMLPANFAAFKAAIPGKILSSTNYVFGLSLLAQPGGLGGSGSPRIATATSFHCKGDYLYQWYRRQGEPDLELSNHKSNPSTGSLWDQHCPGYEY